MRTTGKFSILPDTTVASATQTEVAFSPRKPLQNVEINLHREVTTLSTPKEALLNRKMAKPRKRTQETSTQTDVEVERCDNVITADDLTKDAPSESYWKKLAETRGTALNNALELNGLLKEKIKELEEQLKIKEEMLQEARAMADVIRELVGEDN
ncbi:uncharacterized protein LOC132201035 [Neocloeon triangulifer]|uniref:uncharacterized protein LOC132201035 n=1 Tax=Neocloeon triangulifer TaxID=2078957 RepID=UPI00286EB653|nr:uncharacterized protein LOC132201035 [Neocloeon triangulifer]